MGLKFKGSTVTSKVLVLSKTSYKSALVILSDHLFSLLINILQFSLTLDSLKVTYLDLIEL